MLSCLIRYTRRLLVKICWIDEVSYLMYGVVDRAKSVTDISGDGVLLVNEFVK